MFFNKSYLHCGKIKVLCIYAVVKKKYPLNHLDILLKGNKPAQCFVYLSRDFV